MEKPVLAGPRVRLRAPVPEDAAWRQSLGHHPDIVRMFGGNITEAEPMSAADATSWVRRLMDSPFAWIIETDGTGIGEVRLHNVNRQDQTASLAIGIVDPGRLGQGLGREVISLLSRHAFTTLGLHRLGVRVLAFNERAIRCYQACGFVIEGRERQSCLIGGERYDDIMMGLLAPEFMAR